MIKRILLSEYLILILCAAYSGVAMLAVPGFASLSNLQTVAGYMLPILVASVGLTFVLIIGGIDLSLTSVIALCSVLGATLMSQEAGWPAGQPWSTPAGVTGMLLLGSLLGGLNGLNVTLLRIPAFMATLAMMMFGSGWAIWWTQSGKIFGLPASFTQLGQNPWLSLLIVGSVVAAAHYTLSRTLYGRWLYAIGLNARAAFISGVPVKKAVFAAYVISGLFAGLSAVLLTASLETGDPEMARTALLDIIGATVIGGTSLYGGKGKVTWTVFGVLFLALLDNSLNMIDLSFFFITMVKGAVILLAALLDTLRNQWGGALT